MKIRIGIDNLRQKLIHQPNGLFLKMPQFILYVLMGMFTISCATPSGRDTPHSDTAELDSIQSVASESVQQSIIFDVPIHLDERIAIKKFSEAGILKCDTVKEANGRFLGAVVEFAGVKFEMNKGFIFLTSKQDKKTIDALVSEISKYYDEPFIDGEDEPEWNYYHWNLYDTIPDNPYIRIRPVHSEDGGLMMTWQITPINKDKRE